MFMSPQQNPTSIVRHLLLAGAVAGSLFASQSAGALSISNGDFSDPINYVLSTANPNRDFVTWDLVDVFGPGWYTSNNPDKTFLSTIGGPSAIGDYGAIRPNGGAATVTQRRGIVNVVNDNFATTGEVELRFDALLLNAGTPNLIVRVWGVNDADPDAEGVQWDGMIDLTGPINSPDALDLRNLDNTAGNAFYSGTSFVELYWNDAAGLGIVPDAIWNEDIRFTFDIGPTGFDQIVIGVAIWDSPVNAPFSGIDNLSVVPEPTTLSMLGLGAAAAVAFGYRRRHDAR